MDNFYIDDYKRVWGNAHINGEVIVTAANNSLTIIDEDNVSYTVTVTTGSYETVYTKSYSELIIELNSQFSDNSIPIEALLGGYHKDEKYNIVVFKMTNDKSIQDISGTFFNEFFAE